MNSFTDAGLFLRPRKLRAPAGLGQLSLWRHRWVTRRQLLELTAAELADIGLTTSEQRAEGAKAFWRE